MIQRLFLSAVMMCMVLVVPCAQAEEAIDRVWSGHSVGFDIELSDTHVYVAYYDANRQLTVAQRPLNNPAHWVYHKVDTWLGWDSHNLIAMSLDRQGALHVAGNMHVDPLTYFRSDTSGDVRTLRRVDTMVGPEREAAMTYPVFLQNQAGDLIFKYRDGTSGRGDEIYNIYDDKVREWRRLTSAPLVDGEGKYNAYFMGPVKGPDGLFHIAWVWRDTPMADTNHDLSYAKSPDLISWQKADGTPLTLPIRLGEAEIVDPVPVKGGMINNNTVVGFDDQGRAMITYHKYDSDGDTQIWVARYTGQHWERKQVSQWRDYRWDFSGGGSLNSEIFVEGARPQANGRLSVPVIRLGQHISFDIRSDDLSLIEERKVYGRATELEPYFTREDGQQINTIEARRGNKTYVLGWVTFPPQRDLPRRDIPAPTVLKLFVKTE
ncbi:MAG: BNR repeat-containing protein [Asticcacaulis sp.]